MRSQGPINPHTLTVINRIGKGGVRERSKKKKERRKVERKRRRGKKRRIRGRKSKDLKAQSLELISMYHWR